jgi:hypothetical protein
MNIFLLIVIVLLIYGFFIYKKAKKKQKELRDKARRHFEDIKLTIDYWLKDKSSTERHKLAKISQTLYDEKRKMVMFTRPGSTSAEQFEYLDEWRLILKEIDDFNASFVSDPIKSELMLEFQSALNELRQISLEEIK